MASKTTKVDPNTKISNLKSVTLEQLEKVIEQSGATATQADKARKKGMRKVSKLDDKFYKKGDKD